MILLLSYRNILTRFSLRSILAQCNCLTMMSFHQMFVLSVFVFSLCIYENALAVKTKESKEELKSNSSSMYLSADHTKKDSEWKLGVGYLLATNLSDQNRNKLYNHELTAKIGYKFHDVNFGLKSGLHYTSLDNEINDDRRLGISSSVLSQSWDFTLSKTHSISQAFSQVLASEDFQRTGAKGASNLGLGISSLWLPSWNTQLEAVVTKIWNEYEYPQSSVGYNIDHVLTTSAGTSVKLASVIRLGFVVSWLRLYSMDQISNDDISYATSISSQLRKISFSLTYTEGGAITEENVAYFFTSDRRKILSFSTGWSF